MSPELLLEGLPDTLHALGFSWRKRSILRRFVHPRQVRFLARPEALPEGAVVAVWASGPFGRARCSDPWTQRVQRVQVEDGFLRSVGLGADLVRPLSWVFDRRGIHFDPAHASDLEHLLQQAVFEPGLLARAARLRERLVRERLGKYNLGGAPWVPPAAARGRRVVLVPGQVETDAAFRAQPAGPRSNLELLQAVRAAEPDAWVLYKPHPDVVAGLRQAGRGEGEASKWCNEVLAGADTAQLLETVDAVHVLSTLTGFEALLRGRTVVCHGLPFYAGWGLTTDRQACARRSRQLSLDELVAGALVCYPRYVSARTGRPCEVEQVVDELIEGARLRPARETAWRRWMRPWIRRD
jgi:capsular polysaccharide export protein